MTAIILDSIPFRFDPEEYRDLTRIDDQPPGDR